MIDLRPGKPKLPAMLDAENIRQLMRSGLPHVRELGIDLVQIEGHAVTLLLPWQERLIGNPETGVLHGGVITALLDTASGFAVHTRLSEWSPIATLDLRIDYLKPAEPGEAVTARAECYKMTKHVAFCRGVAYHRDPEDPIAHAAGSFMLGTSGPNMDSRK
jgi:uncharacterized protein (TIGR00369 family)